MRVLVACEYSGTVRDAFIRAGHDATSCDLLPTDQTGPHHQGDVLELLKRQSYDLMVAHPPCTYLCNSGVRWLSTDIKRWPDLIDGAVFFRALLNADVPRIAVENPVMHKYAAAIIGRRQDQIIHPHQFGHPESKATGLWLKGLPPLIIREDSQAYMDTLPASERSRIHYASPGADRWKVRSTTYVGIAEAMAEQWGHLGRAAA